MTTSEFAFKRAFSLLAINFSTEFEVFRLLARVIGGIFTSLPSGGEASEIRVIAFLMLFFGGVHRYVMDGCENRER